MSRAARLKSAATRRLGGFSAPGYRVVKKSTGRKRRKASHAEAKVGKKAKRKYFEEMQDQMSDLGVLASKLVITDADEAQHRLTGRLPSAADYREFMKLHESLHHLFVKFGARRV